MQWSMNRPPTMGQTAIHKYSIHIAGTSLAHTILHFISIEIICIFLFIYLFGVLHRFQHCTGHMTTGSWKGRGNQYIQFVRVLYCKLPTNGKQLPAFPLQAVTGIEPRPQRWEACYHSASVAPLYFFKFME